MKYKVASTDWTDEYSANVLENGQLFAKAETSVYYGFEESAMNAKKIVDGLNLMEISNEILVSIHDLGSSGIQDDSLRKRIYNLERKIKEILK